MRHVSDAIGCAWQRGNALDLLGAMDDPVFAFSAPGGVSRFVEHGLVAFADEPRRRFISTRVGACTTTWRSIAAGIGRNAARIVGPIARALAPRDAFDPIRLVVTGARKCENAEARKQRDAQGRWLVAVTRGRPRRAAAEALRGAEAFAPLRRESETAPGSW